MVRENILHRFLAFHMELVLLATRRSFHILNFLLDNASQRVYSYSIAIIFSFACFMKKKMARFLA